MDAAQKLSEFIANEGGKNKNAKYSDAKIESFQKRANTLARDALKEDENLLAFALATPPAKIAVLQFRETIGNKNESNHTYLHTFWRELGFAWNQSDGAQYWGAPFRDCGPLRGRWLWPFSVTVIVQNVK